MKIVAFDSGVGGLSAVAPLLRKHQGLEMTYFGDLANLPYGTKSPEWVKAVTRKNLEWLLGASFSFHPEMAIIACNTASAHGMEIGREVAQKFSIPITGVLEPSCASALKTRAKRIVVLATSSTVKSEAYLKQLAKLDCKIPVVQKACPLFVPLVEDGCYEGAAVDWIARRYLDAVLEPGDIVILGCTHYPFLETALAKLYPDVQWIEAGAALLEDPLLSARLSEAPAAKSENSLRLLFSDSTVSSETVAQLLKRLDLAQLAIKVEFVKALA